MTIEKHKTFFYSFYFTLVFLSLILPKSIYVYFPIVWGFIGFGLNGYILWKHAQYLQRILLEKHIDILKRNGATITWSKNNYKLDGTSLITRRKKLKEEIPELRYDIDLFNFYYFILWQAFIGIIILALIPHFLR